MQFDTVFFIGPQGSGKGTQARELAMRLNFYYWEMGAILREVARGEDNLAQQVKEMLDSGVLLQDDFLMLIVKKKLKELPETGGIIFDGIPRRLGQAEFLLGYLRQHSRNNMVTVFIDLPKEESLKRLLLRAQKEARGDDTKESIEKRLAAYYLDTVPVLQYLRDNTTFITVDGLSPIPAVTEQINHALKLQD